MEFLVQDHEVRSALQTMASRKRRHQREMEESAQGLAIDSELMKRLQVKSLRAEATRARKEAEEAEVFIRALPNTKEHVLTREDVVWLELKPDADGVLRAPRGDAEA